MKKTNPFAKTKAKVVGSFAAEEPKAKGSGNSQSSASSNNRKQESKKRSTTSEEDFTSYPLAKKKLVNPASAGPNQPNVDRVANSSIRASLQVADSVKSSESSDSTYLKPLPAGFFDIAPSEKDLKSIRDGYKELNNKTDELFKDKGFAQLVKSSVVKKSINSASDKKNPLPAKQTKTEKNIEALEKEQDEREDSEEMKRQVEEFLKIEELKKQKELLKGKSTNGTSDEVAKVENDQSESSDDELVIDWKKRGK